MAEYRATIKQWGEITGIKVIDPDGFDRKDRQLMERLFTYQEFQHGAAWSTIQKPIYDYGVDKKPVGVLPFFESREEQGDE